MKSINRSKRMFNLRIYVCRLEVSAKVRLKGMNKTKSWHWANFGPPRARTFLQNVSEHGERTNEMTLDECQIKWAGQKFRRRFGLQPGCFLELWTITIIFQKHKYWNPIWPKLGTQKMTFSNWRNGPSRTNEPSGTNGPSGMVRPILRLEIVKIK